MNVPKVNVLVPTYNPNPVHLTEALDSVFKQENQDFDLFLHDDPTDADVRSMTQNYLHDPKVQFERSEKRLGIGGNWNACLPKGNAPYVAYLFQDDTWDPEYIKRAIEIFEKYPNVGLISMNHRYECEGEMQTGGLYQDLKNKREKELTPGVQNGKDFLLKWIERGIHPNLIGEPSFVVLRRKVIEQVGPFLEDMSQFLDSEYWLRCLQVTDWYFEPSETGAFRVHSAAATSQNEASGAGIYDRLRCFEILIRSLRGKERSLAIHSRNRAFEIMVKKFFERRKTGKSTNVKGKGGGTLKKFAIRHPILVARAILKAVVT
jgi:glycosyltransferase involved in cell wall biosynthesis